MSNDNARSQSFPIVSSSSKDDSGPHNITYIIYILLHDLEGLVGPDGVPYERVLGSWLRSVAKRHERGSHVSHMFPFNLQTLLEKGENEFERLSKKLYRKIASQPWSSWSAVVTPTSRAVNDGNTEPVASSPVPPTIVFLCHGVGTWLVKDMLSTNLGNFVAVNTLSVIPLDTLRPANEQPAGRRYIASAQNHLRVFGVAKPDKLNTQIADLSKLLERADSMFAKLEEFIQEVPGLHKLPKWIADPVPLWTFIDRIPGVPIDPFNIGKGIIRRKIFGLISKRAKEVPNQTALEERLNEVLKKLDEVKSTPSTTTHDNLTAADTRLTELDGTEMATGERKAIEPRPRNRNHLDDLIKADDTQGYPLSSLYPFHDLMADRRPWSSPDPGLRTPIVDVVRREVKDKTQTLLSGHYKQYAQAINSLQLLKEQCEKRAFIKGEIAEVLTELIRLLAHWLMAGPGNYWEAAVELLKAPGLRSIHLKMRNDAVDVNSANVLGDLALLFAYIGFFTKATRLIRLVLKSVDQKLDEIREYEQQQGADETLDEARISKAEGLKSELMLKRDTLAQTAAEIYCSAGDYRHALKLAEQAWLGFREHVGTKDVRTLDAQVLRAELLAHNSRVREAEVSCYEASQALSAKCGSQHPQTLNALRTLTFIFRMEFRLAEAIDTARSLCQLAEEATADTHPLTISARAEFARSLGMDGQYKAAESEYEKVINNSRTLYSFTSEHPETLLYQSELARVYMHLGLLEKAERLALEVLKGQHHAYQYERVKASDGNVVAFNIALERPPRNDAHYHSDDILLHTVMDDLKYEMFLAASLSVFSPGQKENGLDKSLTAAEQITELDKLKSDLFSNAPRAFTEAGLRDRATQEILFMIKREIATGRGMSNARLVEELRSVLSRLRVHPWLLRTIQLLVDIYIKKGPGDSKAKLACEMADLALQWHTKTMGEVHDTTLSAKYKLALAIRNTGDNHKAQQLLLELYQHQALYFKDDHPEMLEVKRELIMTSVAAEMWQDPDSFLTSSPDPSDDDLDDIHNKNADCSGNDNGTDGTTRPTPTNPGASPSSAEIARPMTFDDWGAVERQSVLIARTLEGRMGPNHPGTLQTYLWILAIQLMVGKLIEASETSRLIVTRSCNKEVLNQRPIKALKMLEHVALLSLEANLVADALDVYDEIVSRGKQLVIVGPANQPRSLPVRGLDSLKPGLAAAAPILARDEQEKIFDLVLKSQEKINFVMDTGAEGALEKMREMYDLYASPEGSEGDGDIIIANALRFASRAKLSADHHSSVRFLRSRALRRYALLVDSESFRQHFEGEMDGKKWKAGMDILGNAFKLLQSTLVDHTDVLEASKRLHAELQRTLEEEESRRKKMALEGDDLVDWRLPKQVNGIGTSDGNQGEGEDTINRVVERCLKFSAGLE